MANDVSLGLLNEVEAAEALGIRPNTLAVWRTTHRYPLPYVKVGRLVRYRMRDIYHFLEERTIGAKANQQ